MSPAVAARSSVCFLHMAHRCSRSTWHQSHNWHMFQLLCKIDLHSLVFGFVLVCIFVLVWLQRGYARLFWQRFREHDTSVHVQCHVWEWSLVDWAMHIEQNFFRCNAWVMLGSHHDPSSTMHVHSVPCRRGSS